MDEQVALLLQNTLSSAASTRISAEISLKSLHQNGEAALSLARICLAQNADLSLRQSAAINLKKYVKEHWSAAFETFEGNPPSSEIKDQIRQAVFAGLSDSSRKIRLACAVIVAEIASSDWPDEWPTLLDSLVQLLGSGRTESVHGVMRVLSDFVSADLSEDQLLPLSNVMLPRLLQILGDERHSPVTRAQSVAVFSQCISTLYMVQESHPQAAKYATQQVIPQWASAFEQVLLTDPAPTGDWSSLHIRTEIFSTLNTVMTTFPKSISSLTPNFMMAAIQHLTRLTVPFRASALNEDLEDQLNLETEDDISLTLPTVLSTLLAFVANASRRPSGKHTLANRGSDEPTELLQQLAYLAVYYGQITTENEERWTTDVDAFVEDQDEEMPASNLRTDTLDLISGFITFFGNPAIKALVAASDRIAQESDKMQGENQADWWKGYESVLTHLASASRELNEQAANAEDKGQQPLFNLEKTFERFVGPFLSRPDLPFLQGTALIFSSRYAVQLPEQLQQQFFESTLQLFEARDTSLILKVSALRALKNFCQLIPQAAILASLGDRITSDLLPLVSQAREGILLLVLDTLDRTVKLGSVQQNGDLCDQLVTAVLQTVTNASLKNPVLQSTLCELVRAYSSSSSNAVYDSLVRLALPQLAQLLAKPDQDDDTRQQVQSAIVVIGAILDGRPSPLGEGIFKAIGQSMFDTLSRTDDANILQEGLVCLTYVVRKDVDQLMQWQGNDGQSGLAALFHIIAMVLRPDRSESASLFIGDLVLHVFRRAGDAILPVMPDLLQALLLRLTTAQTATFTQSLILPFAYLMHNQTDTVLDLLENVTVDGKSGVEILLRAWTDNVDSILGFWSNRISSVALSKLLLTNRPSLNNLTVKGDLVVNKANSGVILTRSRARQNPDQYTQIPFKAKALKIILHDLEQNTEPVELEQSPHGDESDDEEWEDDEDAEAAQDVLDLLGKQYPTSGISSRATKGVRPSPQALHLPSGRSTSARRDGDDDSSPLSKLSFIGGESSFFNEDDEDEDDGEEDEDLKTDPVYMMDLSQHLKDTVRAFAGRDQSLFQACLPYLDASETHTLHSI